MSRTQHGRQREPSVKTLRFSPSSGRHCVLSGGTRRRALPRHQSEEMKMLNISFLPVGIEPTTSRVYSHTLVLLRHDWPQNFFIETIKIL